MKYITIPATRPQYLEKVIEAIKLNRNRDDYTLVLALEPCYKKQLPDLSWIPNVVLRNEKTLGVSLNQFFVLDYAFSRYAEYVIRLEDDLCPSPDATELAEWYVKQQLSPEHMCMILWSGSQNFENPTKIGVRNSYCPWGNVITKFQWENHWKENMLNKENAKVLNNNNDGCFDSCLNGYTIKNNLLCHSPILSRIRNIGVDGVYSNQWVWSDTFSGKVSNTEYYKSSDYSL
jgi:hypothetical protein